MRVWLHDLMRHSINILYNDGLHGSLKEILRHKADERAVQRVMKIIRRQKKKPDNSNLIR